MRLALAPEVVEAEEALVVEAGVDEDTAVDARVVGGVLGKRAYGVFRRLKAKRCYEKPNAGLAFSSKFCTQFRQNIGKEEKNEKGRFSKVCFR